MTVERGAIDQIAAGGARERMVLRNQAVTVGGEAQRGAGSDAIATGLAGPDGGGVKASPPTSGQSGQPP